MSVLDCASPLALWDAFTAVISIFHLPSSIRYLRGVRFRKITIIGVGLLGGSIGLAVKRRQLVSPGGVAGFVRRVGQPEGL